MIPLIMLLTVACSDRAGTKGPVETVNAFFRCLDHHDVECLWDMSGPKTKKIFTDLSSRLTRAHQLVYTKIPEKDRARYIKALMLDKFPAKSTPVNCMAAFLNVKGMKAPSIPKEKMVVGKLGKNFTVYLPGNTTLMLIDDKGSLKPEVLGNTLMKLPLYGTLMHNLDTLDRDVAMFEKIKTKEQKKSNIRR